MKPTPENLEHLLRSIAQFDFAGVPIYIALTSMGLPSEFTAPLTWGYYSPGLDLALSAWLKSTGEWQDRGVCFVLDDVAIAAEAAESAADDPVLQTSLFEQWLIATAIHETSHALGQSLDLSPAICEEHSEFLNLQLAALCRDPAEQRSAIVPWRGHDGAFIRRLLHLHYRAEQILHFRIPLAVAFSGSHYGLSNIWSYVAALSDEPAQLCELPICKLADIRPPAEFAALWRRDVQQWQDDEQRKFAMQTRAVEMALTLFGE